MKTRAMGQEAELVQLRKELKQLNAENVARSERIEVQFAGMCTKYDDQFAYMSAQHEKMKASRDVQFQELKGFVKQLMRGQEQREKSVSIDTLEANFGSSSKEERYKGKAGGFYEGDGGMEANFEEPSGISQEEATENKIMQDSQQLEKAFLARAELQETSKIGQEALFQKEEILSKARDSDDGKMNSLESLENPHVHHIPQPVASVIKEFGNQEVGKEEERLQKGGKTVTLAYQLFDEIPQPLNIDLATGEFFGADIIGVLFGLRHRWRWKYG
jgi:hypothetical protein